MAKITLKDLNSKKIFSQRVTDFATSIAKIKYIRNSLKQFQLNFIIVLKSTHADHSRRNNKFPHHSSRICE